MGSPNGRQPFVAQGRAPEVTALGIGITLRYSKSVKKGAHAISHRCPSGSAKYPEYPPQSRSTGDATAVAPAFTAAVTASSTSSRVPKLAVNVTPFHARPDRPAALIRRRSTHAFGPLAIGARLSTR